MFGKETEGSAGQSVVSSTASRNVQLNTFTTKAVLAAVRAASFLRAMLPDMCRSAADRTIW